MSNNSKNICVVLPTYNEAGNIHNTLEKIFLNQPMLHDYKLSVLVVDDNSPDNTAELVKGLMSKYSGLRLISGEKKGLGDAYKRGIDYALKNLKADLIIQMDADGQHDPGLIPKFIGLTNNYDVIIGSRFVEGGSAPDLSSYRLLLSKLGNFLVRYLGGAYLLRDCTSGYRVIKREILEKCQISKFPTTGYSFQSWLICELLRQGAVIKESPIVFAKRETGESKLSLADQLEFFLNIVRIRFNNSEDFLKYCLVGLSGVIVNLGVYYYLTRFISFPVTLSSPVAIEVSIISNFFLNNFWTFKTRPIRKSLQTRLLNFHLVAGFAGIINYLFFLVLIYLVNIYDIFAVILGIAIGIIFNYAGNSLWTFRKEINKPLVSRKDDDEKE